LLAYGIDVIDRLTPATAREAVDASDDGLYGILFRHGTLELGYYRPRGRDSQQPHDQDELYVIDSGSGVFLRDGERTDFAAGDVLFVPAGVRHRFAEFTSDFAAWVIFYGPRGGESDP